MPERSCRRTASAHASISALIWVLAVWPCCIMALAPNVWRRAPLGRTARRISDTRNRFFMPGHAEIVGKATGSRERAPDDRLRVRTIRDDDPGRWWARREERLCPPALRLYFFTSGHSLASSGFAASSGEIVAISL